MEQKALGLLSNSHSMEAIAFCGSLPPGVTGSIYTMIAKHKPQGVIILLDAFQNAECLQTGNIDIVKINAEEARILAHSRYLIRKDSENEDLKAVGIKIHGIFKISILAITNGPLNAILLERVGFELVVTYFAIPLLDSMNFVEPLSNASSLSHQSSLPEPTGEALSKSPLLNPLGAGDTCSAIFLLEYLDTRNAVQSFVHGLAAASASCLCVDSTSLFDLAIQRQIAELIKVDKNILLPNCLLSPFFMPFTFSRFFSTLSGIWRQNS